jgi:hypothetical protein
VEQASQTPCKGWHSISSTSLLTGSNSAHQALRAAIALLPYFENETVFRIAEHYLVSMKTVA